MARTKRGVTSRAKHKKVFKAVKGQYGRRKTPSELQGKQWKRQCNMPTEIEKQKRENLDLCGYKNQCRCSIRGHDLLAFYKRFS